MIVERRQTRKERDNKGKIVSVKRERAKDITENVLPQLNEKIFRFLHSKIIFVHFYTRSKDLFPLPEIRHGRVIK